MEIGQKVAAVRKQLGYTQGALAEASNLSLSTIQRIEKGKVVSSIHTLKILSTILGVDLLANATRGEKRDVASIDLLLTFLFTSGLSFFPPLNIIFLYRLWTSNRNHPGFASAGQKLLSFQTYSFIALMLSIILLPMLTFLLTGQKMIGQLNSPFLVYLCYVLANLGMSWFMYRSSVLITQKTAKA